MATSDNKMGVMPIPKLLISMSLPLIISMLVQALYNIVDSIFVSMISENALTAVSLAFPAQNLLIAFAGGTVVGVNSLLARSLGEKNQEQANQTANHAIFLWIVMSVIFAIIGLTCGKLFFTAQTDNPEIIEHGSQYFAICLGLSFGCFGQFTFERLLQATGRTFETMIIQGLGAIINIIFDPIFIFVFDMGVAGAAYATVLGQIVACFIGVYINKKKNKDITINMKGFRPNPRIIKQIYQVALPSIVMQSVGSIMNFCMNQILIGFTATATAVFGVYYKLQSFFFMPMFGMTNALVPIVAFNYGAKRKDRMMGAMKLAMILISCLMVLGTLSFEIIPQTLLGLFNASEEMLSIGVPALRIIGIHFPLAGIAITCSSVFQATGHGMYSLINSLIRQVVILLPAAFLLSLTGNVNMVWWAFFLAELSSFTISLFLLRRLLNKLDF